MELMSDILYNAEISYLNKEEQAEDQAHFSNLSYSIAHTCLLKELRTFNRICQLVSVPISLLNHLFNYLRTLFDDT